MRLVVYHFGPFNPLAVVLYTAIFVVIKLATRSNKPESQISQKLEDSIVSSGVGSER